MTQSDTKETRANRDGDPCPPWCATDHHQLTIPDKPQYGHLTAHVSDPITAWEAGKPTVQLVAGAGQSMPAVELQMPRAAAAFVQLMLGADQAEALSVILRERDPGDLLADQLLAAAAIAREGR